ncbi:MAG: DUF3368 domain-containing protein [Deltaproteobacteria bacterium]
MIVVPDAGPLIYLATAGHLDLLAMLYQRVVVPRVVYDEVVVAGAGQAGAEEVAAASWIEVMDGEPDADLARFLDRGEAAAIPLAARLGAVLLSDHAAARGEARRRSLVVIGTLGVLLLARNRGHVERILPVIERVKLAGMYVGEALIDEVAAAAGEGETRRSPNREPM